MDSLSYHFNKGVMNVKLIEANNLNVYMDDLKIENEDIKDFYIIIIKAKIAYMDNLKEIGFIDKGLNNVEEEVNYIDMNYFRDIIIKAIITVIFKVDDFMADLDKDDMKDKKATIIEVLIVNGFKDVSANGFQVKETIEGKDLNNKT